MLGAKRSRPRLVCAWMAVKSLVVCSYWLSACHLGEGLVFVLSLVEGFAAAEIGVQLTAFRPAVTIAATVSGTYLVVP